MDRTIFSRGAPWSWTFPLLAAMLTGCGTTHPLPPYEPPLARANVQSVRTTAYTHTESDHLEYGNHNALGGTLHAAALPETVAVAPPSPADPTTNPEEGGFHSPGAAAAPISSDAPLIPPNGVGSAAADWSRWPAGTVFRLAATGQVYQVDDYGWALAGRNTIDLYQPTRAAMNAWGTRQVQIQIMQWGDPAESLRKLRRHQEYRHIHRMVLELEGEPRAAAALE